jgi:hypothetical protein
VVIAGAAVAAEEFVMLGWMLVSVALGAQAKLQAVPGVPCMDPSLSAVLPEAGAVDVPLDARYLAMFQDNGCGGQGFVEWFLTEADDAEPTQDGTATGSARTFRASLDPDEDLGVELPYSLIVRDIFGDELMTTFTSGVDFAAEVSAAPVGAVSQATFDELDRTGEGTWTAVVDVDFVGFSSGLSLVQVYDAAAPADVIAEATAVEAGTLELALQWTGAEADELCVYFVQEDEAGRVSERSEDACAGEVERVGGCSALGSLGVAGWWLTLLPLWRRRA